MNHIEVVSCVRKKENLYLQNNCHHGWVGHEHDTGMYDTVFILAKQGFCELHSITHHCHPPYFEFPAKKLLFFFADAQCCMAHHLHCIMKYLSLVCTNAHAWMIFFWWRFCMATATDTRSGTGEGRKAAGGLKISHFPPPITPAPGRCMHLSTKPTDF